MNTFLYGFLEDLSLGIVLIPLLLLIYKWKKVAQEIRQLFLFLFIIEVLSELFCFIFAINYINNYFIIHLYTFGYGLLLILIYYRLKRNKFALPIILIMFVSFIYEFVNYSDQPNTITYIFLCAVCIMYSLGYYVKMLNNEKIANITQFSLFWVNSAVLFYFGTTFCLTLFETYIHFDNPDVLNYIWPIQLIANIIYHLILTKGLWLMKRT